MKKLFYILILSSVIISCNSKNESENSKESEIVTVSEIEKPISDLSIYNLPEKWTNQDGENIELKDYRGNVLVMVMIYTSCQAACPRLVADMRHIEEKVNQKNKNIKFILVSIDPEVDTPERLKEFSIENQMSDEQWVFLRSNEEQTREFSAVLAVNYKKISPIDFSHSNIISVFNPEGEMVFQQEGLGVSYDKTIKVINEEVDKM
ncbi:MAG: SCO family protein [Moheibacter sp.]